MTKRWMLDANALVNLYLTFSLIQEFEDIDPFFSVFSSNGENQLITTSTVMEEVNRTIKGKMERDSTPSFYTSSKCKLCISKNKGKFKPLLTIRDVSKNQDFIQLMGTQLANQGEKSLVTAYFKYYHSLRGVTRIVSNDYDDVTKNLSKLMTLKDKQSKSGDDIQSIFDFIHEIYSIAGLSNHLTAYTIFVSNIEAQVFKRDKFNSVLHQIVRL